MRLEFLLSCSFYYFFLLSFCGYHWKNHGQFEPVEFLIFTGHVKESRVVRSPPRNLKKNDTKGVGTYLQATCCPRNLWLQVNQIHGSVYLQVFPQVYLQVTFMDVHLCSALWRSSHRNDFPCPNASLESRSTSTMLLSSFLRACSAAPQVSDSQTMMFVPAGFPVAVAVGL